MKLQDLMTTYCTIVDEYKVCWYDDNRIMVSNKSAHDLLELEELKKEVINKLSSQENH